jgi:hypothetical protein
MLRTALGRSCSGILVVGITPPRRDTTPERRAEIAKITLERLTPLNLDALILYDIDDESDRNPQQRPFPYLPTIDPVEFREDHLEAWSRPVVIYRCVGKYREHALESWLRTADPTTTGSVFVGASSREKAVLTNLDRAYELHRQLRPELPLGGVVIPERYIRGQDEHLRMLAKQDRGCEFFISQVIYDLDTTKSLLSDYFYLCAERGVTPQPVVLTLSVCGSLKTLAFLRWLGVNVPRWLDNALRHAADPLAESYEQCLANARELVSFCRRLQLPFGFNVESVSNRRVEIEASMSLAAEINGLLGR